MKTITYVDGVATIGGTMVAVHTTANLVLKGGIDRPNKTDLKALAAGVVGERKINQCLVEALTAARDTLHDLAKDTTLSAIAMQNKSVTAYMRARDALAAAGIK